MVPNYFCVNTFLLHIKAIGSEHKKSEQFLPEATEKDQQLIKQSNTTLVTV